ncbi:hypothetical protein V491_01729 [Pseudogymnoascus sp. VKM F-3775]|nr:hypothetical protein V491_01729 [Pseudogymnoascus sp. VKM F-3775]
MPPTRLHTMKTEQHCALRSWYSQQNPRPTQKACIEWFLQTYNHRLTQSTVSDSLSSRFASLDSPTSSISPTTQRRKAAAWPELEAALFDWQKCIDESGEITTGDILQEKAKQIWQLLP